VSALKGKPQRWIILPDTHLPYEDKAAYRAIEKYMGDHRWDGWVQLGDLIDFNEISRFEEDNNRLDKVGAIGRSYAAAEAFLDRHRSIIGRKARMVYIEGNHEQRVTDYIDKHPVCAGLLEVQNALRLKQRGIEWVPYWSKGAMFKLGKANFIHGRYTSANHAKKHLDDYGVNLFYGHLHTMQTYSKRTLAKNETKEAACLGCLCRYDQAYLRGGPTDWQLGFAVFYVWPDGFFQHFVIRIFKSRFISPEGKQYGPR
jgi:predicted phosphodiesterase